jgi:hypothetical protein
MEGRIMIDVKPHIDETEFGWIRIDGQIINHDVIIKLDGEVLKRKKKLSKEVYGTSHKVSLEEAQYVFEDEAEQLVVGTGQYGALELSDEAKEFFNQERITIKQMPTPDAVSYWNNTDRPCIGLFHVNC